MEQKKAYTVSTTEATVVLLWSVYTGRKKATVEKHSKFVSKCGAASSVDSITDYNEYYSILSCRSRPVYTQCSDKARSRTCVNIGSAFQHWRELKEREGLGRQSGAKVALFLLDW